MNRHRIIIAVVIAAVVAAALVWGFTPRAVRVDVSKVKRAPLAVTVEEEGRTRVKDRYTVSAPVAGLARRIPLEAGDEVKKGQTLAEIEPQPSRMLDPRALSEAQSRVRAAEAAVKAAEEARMAAATDERLAQIELGRAKKLFESGFAARETLDKAEANARKTKANLRSAGFNVEVAAFELEAARAALRYQGEPGRTSKAIAVSSPVAGRVLKLLRKSEGAVGEGQALMELGDPKSLEVEADVLSADAVRISSGTKVRFERWGGEGSLEGSVRVVEPAGFTKVSALGVEEQRVLVIVDIVSSPAVWARLGDAYRVEAIFVLWEGDKVLQVPSSAVFRDKDGWAVFAVDGERAKLRPVRIGKRSALAAEVLSGLSEGDEVITHPYDSIADGTKVKKR